MVKLSKNKKPYDILKENKLIEGAEEWIGVGTYD